MDRLKDKVAIVTGSTSGIGTGIAKMYGAEGAKVVVCGRREERGQAVVDAITGAGGCAMYHFMDVTKPESVDALIADTVAAWGSMTAVWTKSLWKTGMPCLPVTFAALSIAPRRCFR